MTPTQPTTPLLLVVSRVFWMLLGPMFLILLTIRIINAGTGWLSLTSFTFLAVLVLMPLARWIECSGGNPKTATGEPASPHHLRAYTLSVLPPGWGLWIVANLVGNWLAS